MNGFAQVLQGWAAEAEGLAMRAPELARVLAGGSWPAAALAAATGLALLVAGARLGRFLACGGGALVGWVAGGLLAPVVRGWLPVWLPPWAGAVTLGLASLLGPTSYPSALGALPGVLLGLRIPVAGREWLGGLFGALVLALLALSLRRFVLAATAAVAGALLLVLASLALSHQVPALLALARRPLLLGGLAATLAVAGTVYQLGAGVVRGQRGARAPAGKLEGVEGG
jgi:hypothetical protein